MIYSSILTVKDNLQLPLFTDGKPMHSKYNPTAEAQNFVSQYKGHFFLVAGIGGGFHIQALLNCNPDATIIAFEKDKESLDFCLKMDIPLELSRNEKIKMCTQDELYDYIISNYIPSLHGNLQLVNQRAWIQHTDNSQADIIQQALKSISADYSVQSHFGKMWQHNIICNYMFFLKHQEKISARLPQMDANKTAAIIAAGPSLDTTLKELSEHRNDYAVISTDTAFSTLIKQGIKPDAVVCIDPQNVSHTHFLESIDQDILFFLDAGVSPSIFHHIIKKQCSVCLLSSAHPLTQYLYQNSLNVISSGNGTVTQAAMDIARLMGFFKIRLFGADFSYPGHKPYARGTYLDGNFSQGDYRTQSKEKQFSSLMFRTEILPISHSCFTQVPEKSFTTEILLSYQNGILNWCQKYGYKLKEPKGFLEAQNIIPMAPAVMPSISSRDTFSNLLKELESILNSNNIWDYIDSKEIKTQLPYIAWLRKNEEYEDFFDLLKLAYKSMLRYTIEYES